MRKLIVIIVVLLFASALACGVIFLIPIPYTAIEIYSDQEPYTVTEFYEEDVPMTVEECKTDISLNPVDYLSRGINNIESLLNGDVSKLIEACKDVVMYRKVTKSRDVVKYKLVKKERSVVKRATLFMMWTGQVDYYYEV